MFEKVLNTRKKIESMSTCIPVVYSKLFMEYELENGYVIKDLSVYSKDQFKVPTYTELHLLVEIQLDYYIRTLKCIESI